METPSHIDPSTLNEEHQETTTESASEDEILDLLALGIKALELDKETATEDKRNAFDDKLKKLGL